MKSKCARSLAHSLAITAVAAITSLFIGCEDDSSTAGKSFSISPAKTTLTKANQAFSLTAVGGLEPLVWTNLDTTLGSLSGSGRTVTYTRKGTANGVSTIRVTDRQSWIASASITQTDPDETLSLTPATATLQANGDKYIFTAKGGRTPYSWSLGNTGVGQIEPSGSAQAIYTRSAAGNNTLLVTDRLGQVASAQITQPPTPTTTNSPLAIAPTTLSIASDGVMEKLTASGGTAPYTWSVQSVALGALDRTTGTFAVYTRNRSGDNVITVKDAAGTECILIVRQP